MKKLIIAFMIVLPSIGFSQEKILKGKYCELSEPTKVEYRFKGSRFEYSAKADVVDFYGKGNYEIRNDSLLLYFDHYENESTVKYEYAESGNTVNDFQITIIEDKTKTGLIGAKVQFLKSDGAIAYEDNLNEQGEVELRTSENIKSIVISYLGQADLILNVSSQYSKHQYSVLWKNTENSIIDGEIWRYEITDIKSRSFKLKKNGEYFTYKKKCF
jgi:hypothetical protein